MHRFKIKRNLTLLPIINIFHGFNLISLILVLYMHELLKSYTMAMFIFSLLSITCAIFEVPTGLLSDKIGRAKTVTLNAIFYLLSLVFLYLAKDYNPVILLSMSTICSGISISFSSGNNEALEYETMKQLKKTDKYDSFSGKLSSIRQFSFAIASVVSGILSSLVGYEKVVLLNMIPIFAYLILSFFIVEPDVISNNKNKKVSIFRAIKKFRKNKKLRIISLSRVFTTSTEVASNRFEVIYFSGLIPIWMLGIIKFIKLLSLSISFWFSGFFIKKYGAKETLVKTKLYMIIFKVISVTINGFISPFIFATAYLFHGINLTNLKKLSQEEFSSSQRATMGSLVSIFESLFMFIFTCLVGIIADLTNPRIAITSTILPMIIAIFIYNRIFSKYTDEKYIKEAAE